MVLENKQKLENDILHFKEEKQCDKRTVDELKNKLNSAKIYIAGLESSKEKCSKLEEELKNIKQKDKLLKKRFSEKASLISFSSTKCCSAFPCSFCPV